MFLKHLLKVVGLMILLLGMSNIKLQAQTHLGVEGGVTVASFYSLQNTTNNLYSPTIGARLGIVFEQEFTNLLALKTGVLGTLKGSQIQQLTQHWHTGHISIPVLINITPIKPLKIGLGGELNILVANNLNWAAINTVTFGLRSEIGWQINPTFRLIAHGTIGVLPSHTVYQTNEQGNVVSINSYQHITGGISLAYTFKTFSKK